MVVVAQLVRAPLCESGGRRFKSGLPPHFRWFTLLISPYLEAAKRSPSLLYIVVQYFKYVPVWIGLLPAY